MATEYGLLIDLLGFLSEICYNVQLPDQFQSQAYTPPTPAASNTSNVTVTPLISVPIPRDSGDIVINVPIGTYSVNSTGLNSTDASELNVGQVLMSGITAPPGGGKKRQLQLPTAIVKNTEGIIVGQIAGDGVSIDSTGIDTIAATIPVRTDVSRDSQYTVAAVATYDAATGEVVVDEVTPLTSAGVEKIIGKDGTYFPVYIQPQWQTATDDVLPILPTFPPSSAAVYVPSAPVGAPTGGPVGISTYGIAPSQLQQVLPSNQPTGQATLVQVVPTAGQATGGNTQQTAGTQQPGTLQPGTLQPGTQQSGTLGVASPARVPSTPPVASASTITGLLVLALAALLLPF